MTIKRIGRQRGMERCNNSVKHSLGTSQTSQRLCWRFKTVVLSCLCLCGLFPRQFKKEHLKYWKILFLNNSINYKIAAKQCIIQFNKKEVACEISWNSPKGKRTSCDARHFSDSNRRKTVRSHRNWKWYPSGSIATR